MNGYSATIVRPGLKGVGDKISGSSEESIGYDDLLEKFDFVATAGFLIGSFVSGDRVRANYDVLKIPRRSQRLLN
ncbi:hypothetical protein [Methanosarcina horonobensis]|nr:hypothetical protein [Methanosarcina horonobensis]